MSGLFGDTNYPPPNLEHLVQAELAHGPNWDALRRVAVEEVARVGWGCGQAHAEIQFRPLPILYPWADQALYSLVFYNRVFPTPSRPCQILGTPPSLKPCSAVG